MLLSQVLQNRAIPLGEVEESYKKHVSAVNSTLMAVIKSSMPDATPTPPDWLEFSAAYREANREAMRWVNKIMARLQEVPPDVRSYNDVIVLSLDSARVQAEILVDHPSDEDAQKTLKANLESVSGKLNLVVSAVSGAVRAIQEFQSKLPVLAADLHTVANQSTSHAEVEQKKVDALREAIKELQDEIDQLTAAIVAAGIAGGAAITLATVATIIAFPIGAVAWLFAAPAVVAAAVIIGLDSKRIADAQNRVQEAQNQIPSLEANVASMHLIADLFSRLASQTESLKLDLQAILYEWQTLESEVNGAIIEIRAAAAEASTESFEAVRDDLKGANRLWSDAYAQAGRLDMGLKANTVEVKLGMPQHEVQSALAAGVEVDLIAYLNHESLMQELRQQTLAHGGRH